MVSTSPAYEVYDEPFYVKYGQLFERFGFSTTALRALPGSPGPMVGLVQWAASPLTRFHGPGIRIVNYFLLLVSIGLTYVALRQTGTDPMPRALSILAIPTVWVMGGLGMSEMPASACLAAVLIFWAKWIRQTPEDGGAALKYAALAGLAMGFAGWGRQMVLAACAGPVLFCLWNRSRLAATAVFLGCCAIPLAPVFAVWGGIMPPVKVTVHPGLAPQHAIASFGYLLLFALVASPHLLIWRWRPIAAIGVFSLAANYLFGLIKMAPMKSTFLRLGNTAFLVYEQLASGLLVGCAVFFVWSLAMRTYERRTDPLYFFSAVGLFFIALSPVAISNTYSSRYTAVGFPILVMAAAPYFRLSLPSVAGLLGGVALGFVTLRGYLSQPGWDIPWHHVLPK